MKNKVWIWLGAIAVWMTLCYYIPEMFYVTAAMIFILFAINLMLIQEERKQLESERIDTDTSPTPSRHRNCCGGHCGRYSRRI